ncbi:hypothetical protein GLP43_04815 [Sulfitobacter sp. M39]|uniref:hypothetical protein n=1 Tax=Sulfitobacter sp. M39 TaxID=2675334 RepID=UPI001F480776|nr:hypothetical protein [Sulfitobacter sp. M39]MCF7746889.1 hypothetical protein [Sulfitobacter sp. M39]
MTNPNNKSVLDHDGWPTKSQFAELLGYVANAITITVPVTGGLIYLWSEKSLNGLDLIAFIILLFFGGITTIWSWLIVLFATKGANAGDPKYMAGMIAFGVLALGTACGIGATLGSILS